MRLLQKISKTKVLCLFSIMCFDALLPFTALSDGLQWQIMGHLLEKRMYFQSARIDNEKILVFSGFTKQFGQQLHRARGVVSTSSEIIDVAQRRISLGANMVAPHALSAVVQTADSNVIVLSGLDTDSTTTRVCEMYDRRTNTWKEIGSLLIGRHGHTAAFINAEEILVVGGYAEANYAAIVAEAEILNIRTGKSRMVQDFPCKLNEGVAFTSRLWKPGRTLFTGGRTGGGGAYRLSRIYSFDTVSSRWQYEGELPVGSNFVRIAMQLGSQGIIFAGGGLAYYTFTNTSNTHPSSEIVAETASGIMSVGKLALARYYCTIEPWNDDLYLVIGGKTNNGSVSSIHQETEWFDRRTGKCCSGPPLNEARASMYSYSFPRFDKSGKQIGSCIVVIGGFGLNDITLSSIEMLETSNPEYIETPLPEITFLRWKKIFSSVEFIGVLILFLVFLIAGLIYLLLQVIRIRQRTGKLARTQAMK